jgi:hypothetical protein
MEKLLCLLGISAFTTITFGQTVLYSDDFETPGTFTLGSTLNNQWVINSVYTGFIIPSVPNQPIGISNPNGNYLHPASFFLAGIDNQSNYVLPGSETMLAAMAAPISTIGFEQITLNLWRTGGLDGMRIMYQVNGGGWQDSGHTFSGNVTGWQQESFIIPAGDGVAQFSIAFEFNEATAGDPSGNHYHSIDDISITGINTNGSIATTVSSPSSLTLCEGETLEADYTVTLDQGTINAGNVYTLELSAATGSFASPIAIGTLTSNDLTGTISGTIPSGLSGTGFRVRVNSSNDIIIGNESTADITINQNPTVGAGNNETICEGTAVTLTANNPDGATITWDNSVNDGQAFTPSATTTYIVTALLNGCETTDEVTITVTNAPSISAGPSQIVCEGDEVTLTADNPDGAIISWDGGITDGVPFTATTTQNYEVTAELNGCSSSDIVQVTVVPAPTTPTITLNGDGDLEVSLSGGQSVEWYLDGVIITGQSGATLTPTANGNYSAIVVDGSCASDESTAFEVDFLSVMDFAVRQFTVYPNPTSDNITIQLDGSLVENGTIEVVDMSGKIVLAIPFETQFSVQTLNNGVYFIKISGIDQRIKFVKQ